MKLLKVVCLTSVLFLQFISCQDTGTGPNQKPFKDPREMTWTADTLSPASDAIQLIPEDMLAFAPNDVWLACWSDVAKRVMWHYDGTTWKDSDIEGQSGPIGLDALAGNSSNDLWAGGFYDIINSKIALSHFNGSTWTRVDLKMPGEILDMCRDASGNIWACGRNGVVLEYSQGKWIADTIKINFNYPVEYFLKSIAYYNNKIYVLASSQNTSTLIEKYFYIYGNIKNWTIADSMTLDQPMNILKWGYRGLYSREYSKLYSYGLGGIWQFEQNNWNKISSVDGAINGVSNANDNYIFGVGDSKRVMFYGVNMWENISSLFTVSDPTFVFKNVWTNGDETFITGYGTINGVDKTIIWHGK